VLSALLALAALLLLGPVPRGARPGTPRPRRQWPAAAVGGRTAPALAAGLAVAVGTVLSTPLVGLLAGVCAGVAARAEIARRRRGREVRRLAGLTEALGALAGELRSGRPLETAARVAVRACPDTVSAAVLARALRAPSVLVAVAPQAPSPRPEGQFGEAADRLAAGVRLSARTGCSLAAVVTAIEDDVRARQRQAGELRTALAGPRASAALLAGLPLLGLAMGGGIGADPWRVLTGTGPGQALLVIGVGLELAGLAWSARLARGAVP
jgi:tight adherence protein B